MAAQRRWAPLAVVLVGILAFSTASGASSHNKILKRLREDAVKLPPSGIEIEIVVARFKETDLEWLGEIPKFYEITVYNKVRSSEGLVRNFDHQLNANEIAIPSCY